MPYSAVMRLRQMFGNAKQKVKQYVSNKIEERNKLHEMWKEDRANGTGNYYESYSSVKKRHGIK